MLTNTLLARIPLLCDAPLTLLLFCIGAALGRRLLKRFTLPGADRLERGLFATALGMGLLAYLPFALFAVGWGKPLAVAVVTLLLATFLLPDILAVVSGVALSGASGLRNLRTLALRPAALVLAALLPLLLVTFLQACCPPSDPDGLHYHLTAPLGYLAAGRFYYMPTLLHVHWPLGVEMLFGIGMAFNAHYAAALIQFGFGLLVLLTIYALGRRSATPLVGICAAGLAFLPLRNEMTWAYIDIGYAFYALTAVYAFLIGWQNLTQGDASQAEGWRGWWMLSAVCAGLTASAKLPGILTVALLAGMAFCFLGAKNSRRMTLRVATNYFAVGLLVASPWYLRAWALTGSPVYPYLSALLPVRDWSPEAQKRMTEYFQVFNTFRSRRLDAAQVMKLRAEACLAVVAVGLALNMWRGSRPLRPLFVFLFASLFLQFATSGIYLRFLLYLFPLAFLLVLWLFRGVLDRNKSASLAMSALVALCLLRLPHLTAALRGEIATGRNALAVATGLKSRDAYLTEALPVYPMMRWSNAHLPPNAVVALGVLDAYPALLNRRVLITTPWTQDALRYDSDAQLLSDMKRLGVTHLLLHDDLPLTAQELAALDKEAQVRMTVERPKLLRIAMRCGTVAHAGNGYTLYALDFQRLPSGGGRGD